MLFLPPEPDARVRTDLDIVRRSRFVQQLARCVFRNVQERCFGKCLIVSATRYYLFGMSRGKKRVGRAALSENGNVVFIFRALLCLPSARRVDVSTIRRSIE